MKQTRVSHDASCTTYAALVSAVLYRKNALFRSRLSDDRFVAWLRQAR
jgi:hypothetical protein